MGKQSIGLTGMGLHVEEVQAAEHVGMTRMGLHVLAVQAHGKVGVGWV
jgi:hypothetical protein